MKKLLSFVLTFVMVVGLVPSPALAEAMDEMGVVLQEEVLPDESEPEEEVPTEELDSSEESDAADLEELEIDEVEALGDEEPTGPQSIWIEENIGDSGFDPYWISNSMLNPMYEFRIRASNTEGGSSSSEDAYLWQNATDTITFVSTASESVTYDVALRSDHTHIGGLFYEDDGLMLPLPGGTYTIVFTGEGGVQYLTSSYGFNGRYTVDGDAGIIFRGYYGADNQGAFTRDAFAVYNEGGSTKLETVPFGGKLDLDLDVALTAAVENAPAPTSADLRMYKALDGENTELTLEQLEEQYAAESIDDWPNPFYWNATRTNERIVWSRANPTTGSNATTWSLTANGEDSKEGTFSIRGIDLTKKDGTNPALEPGVYFPVLQLRVDGKTYKFAYNPVEVATTNTAQTNPTIVTQTLPAAMKGVPYATTLSARSGAPAGEEPGTFSWEVTSGTLPQGLSLNTTTGAISGTPAANATNQTFTLTLTETIDGNEMAVSCEYTITVRDQVSLGAISYTPTGVIYIEDSNGTTLHLSVPVSADLRDSSLNLSLSDVAFNVYQTERNSTNSRKWGGILEFANVYNATKHTLEIDAPIQYDTASIDRIEVSLRLKDNNGEPVMMPKEGDTTGEGDWAIVTATVEKPGITIGSYIRFDTNEYDTVSSLLTQERMRLWPYVEGDTAVPADAQTGAIDAQWQLEPGEYVFTIEGKVGIYDADGNLTDKTRWVDIVGRVDDAEPIEGTNPVQYKLTVGSNDGTDHMPRVVTVTYTAKNAQEPVGYRLTALFEDEEGSFTEDYGSHYDVNWYRRKGADATTDVLIGTGNYVQFGPSAYDLYVEVVPTGRDTAFWKKSERVKVEEDNTEPTVNVPRKQLFTGTFTIACASGLTPEVNEQWGIFEVQTPLAAGGYVSSNYWPLKKGGTDNTVEIPNITSGSIITFTPRVELMAGQVSYTVPDDVSEDFSYTLKVPEPNGLITFEGLTFTDVTGTSSTMSFNDGLTDVSVRRGDQTVPFYIASGDQIVLLPEHNYVDKAHFLLSDTDTTYTVTITRRTRDTGERLGTTINDVAARTSYDVTLSKTVVKATVNADDALISNGYVTVPFSNPDKRLCTLLLYDGSGELVESGPAGMRDELRTPYLEAGDYTLYAVDSDTMPRDHTLYATSGNLEQRVLAGDKEDRGSNVQFSVEQGKAGTCGRLIFPRWQPEKLVNQAKSSVTVKTAYTGTLSVNMHAVLEKGVTLGDNAYLEVSTNQPSGESGGYMAPKALTINGVALPLSRWDKLLCTSDDVVSSFTGNMCKGDLAIDLNRAKELKSTSGRFPMDMTLVIPRTVMGYTEASVWLVVNKGKVNEKRTLVGSYHSDGREANLTAPKIVAWKTFSVYGEAGPNANVTVFIDGMRAATAKADGYGYYTAELTLPDGVKDFDEFSIYAVAQWTRGTGANAADYAAVTETSSVTYSTSYPAVERIVMYYQSEPGDEYKSILAYDRGAQPNKYTTVYRAEHDNENPDGEHAKHFWLIEFANGKDISSIKVDIPRSDVSTSLESTDSLTAAKSWIADIAKAEEEYDGDVENLVLQYGRFYAGYSAYALLAALMRNSTDGVTTRSFVTKPEYFTYSPDDMEISIELADILDATKDETRPLEPAANTGAFQGWAVDAGDEDPLTSAELGTFLAGMATGGRMRLATANDIALIANGGVTSLDQLTSSNDIASSLMNSGSNIDEWLILGNGDSGEDYEQELIKVHHTVSKVSMSKDEIRSAMDVRMASAKEVTDAYEDFWYNDKIPAQPVYYDGQWVVEAGGVKSTGTESMPYLIETMDDDGNVRIESLQKYVYVGDEGDEIPLPTEQSDYSWCLLQADKYSYTLTWWDEINEECVTITYTIPPELVTEDERYAFTDVVEQWAIIYECMTTGLGDGVQNYSLFDGLMGNVAPSPSANPTDDLSSLLDVTALSGPQEDGKKSKTPKEQKQEGWWDKTKDFIRNVFGDPENETVNRNNAIRLGKGDVTRLADNDKKKWEEDKERLQGGTLGKAAHMDEKGKAVQSNIDEGCKETFKEVATNLPGGKAVKAAQKGAKAGFWYQDHGEQLKKQLDKKPTPAPPTFPSKKEYEIFRYNRWLIKNRYKYGYPSKYYFSLIDILDDKTLEEWEKQFWIDMEAWAKDKTLNPGTKSDPSGIVYEAVLSNPVEGATVSLYTFNNAAAKAGLDPATFMDSKLFGVEENPQTTGADGRYQWFVPEGYWQVRVAKKGYENFSTGDWGHEEAQPVYDDEGNILETNNVMVGSYGLGGTKQLTINGETVEASEYWMPVLPIQLDVNIPLVSKEPPKVETVVVDETGVTVTFSKYMKVDTVTADLFTINGTAPASVRATDAEAAGDGSVDESGQPVMLARTFRLGYASGAPVDPGAEVAVAFQDEEGSARSYAGVAVSAKNRTFQTTAAAQESRVIITGATVALSTTKVTYNGKQAKPSVTSVNLNGVTLVAGTDYSVSYKNNVNAGTASVVITGKGEYKGTVTKNFTIAQATQTITVSATKSVAMGKTASLGAKTNGDGRLTYKSSNTKVVKVSATGVLTPVARGKATVTVSCAAGNNYKAAAAKKVTVTVTQGTQTVTATNKECVLGKTVSVAAKASGGTRLTYKSSNTKVATVSARGVITGKKIGTAKITITAAASTNWKSATKTITVKVGKANPLVCKAKQATVVVAYSKVRSAAQVTALNVSTTKAQGMLSYANASTNATAKKFVVNKNTGRVTVPKGTAKGKYQVKVRVRAAGNSTYISGTKTVAYYIQVK